MAPQYRYRVITGDLSGSRPGVLYDGLDAADAMTAWSEEISGGAEYVILESLIFRPAGTSAEPGREA